MELPQFGPDFDWLRDSLILVAHCVGYPESSSLVTPQEPFRSYRAPLGGSTMRHRLSVIPPAWLLLQVGLSLRAEPMADRDHAAKLGAVRETIEGTAEAVSLGAVARRA